LKIGSQYLLLTVNLKSANSICITVVSLQIFCQFWTLHVYH